MYESAEILNSNQVAVAKKDADFIGIQARQTTAFESKYDHLDRHESRITGQNISVAQHISALLKDSTSSIHTNRLKGIIKALNHLKDVPTARLERAFVEHLDCCTYRLDAWLLGFVNLQLTSMRHRRSGIEGEDEVSNKGIYLGAYGWVENLKPDKENLNPKELEGELKSIFDPNDENNIVIDDSNAGYIHAPSINQATTAAVLRNAYISNASAEDSEIYKVNLSSERVRMALGIIEGMQQGQSVGALLGYQLERGLHDRYQEAEIEMDAFIYQLRKAFPLRANRLNETLEDEDDLESITQIEARNVVDGLTLVNHINTAENEADKLYPFGKTLQPASDEEAEIINSEIDRLLNINDALADLATAEGVHQAVQANYDRAAGTLDTYCKGSFPQTPEVIRTPRSGVSLTNRVGIHLDAESIAPDGSNPRVVAEPAINELLGDFLPPLSEIGCHISYRIPTYEGTVNPLKDVDITMDTLGLSHLDLFYILDIESDKNLTALDDYILKYVHETIHPRPDIELEIKYAEIVSNKISLFEVAPLINSLRSLILASRTLKPTDITLPNEATASIDSNCSIDLGRIKSAFNQFKDNFSGANPASNIDLVNDTFINLIIDEDFEKTLEDNKTEIINKIDGYVELFLNRLNQLSQFGIPQAGFGFIFDRNATIYADFYKKVLAYKNRWEDKEEKYTGLMLDFGNASSGEEKLEILQKAERTISTNYTIPVPDLNTYVAALGIKKENFDTKLTEINNWLSGSFIKIEDLVNELNKLKKGLEDFDLLTIEIDEEERQIVVLAEDLKIQATKLNEALKNTATAVQGLLGQHDAEASPSKKVSLLTDVGKLLFGEDFKIIPSFQLNQDRASELANSLAAKEQLLDYQKNEEQSDFPVDDWLYGIARVREKLGHWENTVVFSEGFKSVTRDLTPLQLPYKENDSWLGLAYPESYEIESDKLLYTAYLNGFDPTQTLCGLLIDEWTEVISAKQETTGLSFQYDQPNAEPPQSMLLVTPSKFTGSWDWADVVSSMHETLDMAKLRAIEPHHIDQTAYAQFVPATVSAVTAFPFITIALNYAFNNGFTEQTNTNGDDVI